MLNKKELYAFFSKIVEYKIVKNVKLILKFFYWSIH